jgi:hypothetical protein
LQVQLVTLHEEHMTKATVREIFRDSIGKFVNQLITSNCTPW